jgi:tetratricopeptide (TPR) repeat protein
MSGSEQSREWQMLRQRLPDRSTVTPRELAAWHRQQAARLAAARRWSESALRLDSAIAAEPGRWVDWTLRGLANAELGRWAEASEDFERAWRVRPEDTELAYSVALLRLERGDLLG